MPADTDSWVIFDFVCLTSTHIGVTWFQNDGGDGGEEGAENQSKLVRLKGKQVPRPSQASAMTGMRKGELEPSQTRKGPCIASPGCASAGTTPELGQAG